MRSLGGVMQAIGATASEAMGRLEFRSLGSMKDNVSLLYSRILAGISLNNCWDRFVGETGSEQVNRSVRIFWDGISLGGEPQKVGTEASSFAMKVVFSQGSAKSDSHRVYLADHRHACRACDFIGLYLLGLCHFFAAG